MTLLYAIPLHSRLTTDPETLAGLRAIILAGYVCVNGIWERDPDRVIVEGDLITFHIDLRIR